MISLLWQVLCHLLYWTGACHLRMRRQRRRGVAGWTVLAYHRIGKPDREGGPDRVTPERFRRHLSYLRNHYEVITIGEALTRLANGDRPSRPWMSLTFDDGYLDNLSEAHPALQDAGCRATLYVTQEAVEHGLAPWPHRLAIDLQESAGAGREGQGDTECMEGLHPILRAFFRAPAHGRSRLRRRIAGVLSAARTLGDAERRRICDEADRLSGGVGRNKAGPMLGPEDLRRWHAAGHEVGSHTVSHPILARVASPARSRELLDSKRYLERLLDVPVPDIAYPNGREGDWDDGTVRDVHAAGYRSALTTVEGANDPARLDPLRIRRISVGNDSTPVFAVRVSGLLTPWRAALRAVQSRRRHPFAPPAAHRPTAGSSPERRRPLRIAFIGGRGVSSAYSGIERYYEEVGSRLASRGNRMLIYTRLHFSGSLRRHRGLELVPLPTIRWKHLETIVHSLLSTIDVCFRRVDIVQYHALGSSPLAWIPRLAGKKTVVSVRGLDWQRGKWGRVARAYLRFCERTSIVCPNRTAVVSKCLRRHFAERFGRDVRYIPNGVGVHSSSPPETIRKWGLRERGYFLYAGRISPEKRTDLLIEAHRSLSSSYPLVIAGGSSYSDSYIDQVRAGAGRDVIFTGLVEERETMAELYSNALAFVLPSQMEGLSVALLEALSYGAPSLVSDIPENRELVEECGGFLFRVDDRESLTAALRMIVDDPEGAIRVGARARETVRARFNWDVIAQESERFYEGLLSGSPADDRPAAQDTETTDPSAPIVEHRSPPGAGQG